MDRNQLGDTRIVKFHRVGPKILLVQPNYDFRAVSNNADERRSVADAFAQSAIWGFKVEAEENGRVLVDFTPFLLRDAHGVVARLKSSNQGTYRVEDSRSAIYMERTKNFPKNSEFEAAVTFTGEGAGAWLRSVAPTPESITVRMHHSLIELPDAGYKPRVYDPRSGYYAIQYQDYATPIDQPLVKRFIARHRLEKKDPNAKISEAVEPIVYYLDRGAPEPIKSALMEGAAWWNQAFEAAGYKNAFQVKELPADADPLDVRYNVINWVHRSTRGWSYGSTVSDPRTGEIIKGHVLLGSLRVRQDFLIAQGLIEAYEKGTQPDPRMLQMALARLRQLSAHEVGHTIGLMHNYISSVNDRASVMDYPHPYITLDALGNLDFSKAYATGIGAWDKRAVIYGYQHFPAGTDETKALQDILRETEKMNLPYLTDQDARPQGSAHPQAHLWDNGASAAAELRRLLEVRKTALGRFGELNIPTGTPMADLERVLVPLYLAHRYQVEAAAKVVGGVQYSYAMRGDGQTPALPVDDKLQRDALAALLLTLDPKNLVL
ncbi:MAG TPA: zinc-dependent metalloprotease, partial [Saprospiraceae bacterium]|nr:zinc-dependent metalloprotease [Saprospiraceae bacterium]